MNFALNETILVATWFMNRQAMTLGYYTIYEAPEVGLYSYLKDDL